MIVGVFLATALWSALLLLGEIGRYAFRSAAVKGVEFETSG